MLWFLTLLFLLSAFLSGTSPAFSTNPVASVTINASSAPRQVPWWGQSNATSSGSRAAWLPAQITDKAALDAALRAPTPLTPSQIRAYLKATNRL